MTGVCHNTDLGCLQVDPLPDMVPDEWYYMPPPALQQGADLQAGLSDRLQPAVTSPAPQQERLHTSGGCQLHRQPRIMHPFFSDVTVMTTTRAASNSCHIVICDIAEGTNGHPES